MIIPPIAHILLRERPKATARGVRTVLTVVAGLAIGWWVAWWLGAVVMGFVVWSVIRGRLSEPATTRLAGILNYVLAILVAIVLARTWEPLGPTQSVGNLVFAVGLIAGFLLFFRLFLRVYEPVLRWCLRHKVLFLSLPAFLVLMGVVIWFGFGRLVETVTAGKVTAREVQASAVFGGIAQRFPGLGKEFMPPLDEGSFPVDADRELPRVDR